MHTEQEFLGQIYAALDRITGLLASRAARRAGERPTLCGQAKAARGATHRLSRNGPSERDLAHRARTLVRRQVPPDDRDAGSDLTGGGLALVAHVFRTIETGVLVRALAETLVSGNPQ